MFQVFEQLDAALSRHDHVGKDQIEGFGTEELESARRVVADRGFMPSEAKRARERCQRVRIVIDEQQVSFAWQ